MTGRRAYRTALAVALAGAVVLLCLLVPRWAFISPRLAEWAFR